MERYSVRDTIRKDSVLVLDMGQNLAGFPEITVKGQRGQQVKITPGETLTQEGLVNQKQTGRPHYYTYILKGGSETWHPRFSYYGYRYLQIEGDIEVLKNIESCFVYNSAPKTGAFECSNPLFNDAYRLIDRAIRSNWQSVWTDCPHREKLGWLEQDWLNGEGLVVNYDCRTMIEQTMQNIADAQYPNGALPEIAPNYVIFEGSWAPPFLESPEWGGAFIALPFLYQSFYGDDQLITRYRPQMKRYVDYLATQDSCYILRQGLGDWYDYGPGRAGFAQNTPMELVSTAHYYWWNHLMGEARADSIKTAFIKEFYHPATHQYATGSQCAQAIALEMDLIPKGDRDAVLQQLVNDIHAHGDRLTTNAVMQSFAKEFSSAPHTDAMAQAQQALADEAPVTPAQQRAIRQKTDAAFEELLDISSGKRPMPMPAPAPQPQPAPMPQPEAPQPEPVAAPAAAPKDVPAAAPEEAPQPGAPLKEGDLSGLMDDYYRVMNDDMEDDDDSAEHHSFLHRRRERRRAAKERREDLYAADAAEDAYAPADDEGDDENAAPLSAEPVLNGLCRPMFRRPTRTRSIRRHPQKRLPSSKTKCR